MNSTYLGFNNAVNQLTSDSIQRSKIVAAAIAYAIATLAALPSSPVDSASNHFNMTVLPEARNIISDFNENLVFDCRDAVDQVRAFWMMRYTATHPLRTPIFSVERTFFENIIGVETFASPDFYEFVNKHKVDILSLYVVAAGIIVDRGQ